MIHVPAALATAGALELERVVQANHVMARNNILDVGCCLLRRRLQPFHTPLHFTAHDVVVAIRPERQRERVEGTRELALRTAVTPRVPSAPGEGGTIAHNGNG